MNKKELKEKLVSLAERSTFHAIPNIVQTDSTTIKLIWAVCLIMSAGYCAKVLITNTVDYFRYEVETVIKIDRESEAEFPTITLCFVQVCADNELYQLDIDLDRFQKSANSSDLYNSTRTIFENMRNYFRTKTYYNQSLRNILLRYNKTRSIKEHLISCQYSGEACSEKNFEYFQLGEFQRCFKFNSGKDWNNGKQEIRVAKRYGKNNGLQLELIAGNPAKCNLPLTSTSGLILYVHNYTYSVSEDTNGIQLAPGTETSIAIDRTFVNKLPSPYSDCIPSEWRTASSGSSKFVKRTFEVTANYTQQTCFQLCYQNYLVENQLCYDESLPRTSDDVSRASKGRCPKLIDIIEDQNKQPVNNSAFYESHDKECLDSCPTECEYVTYDTTISSSQYPTKTYKTILSYKINNSEIFNSAKDELARTSILALNVFYRSDMFKTIKEKPSIEGEIFVSNIGGALGLFLGISVLSLVELFEILFEICLAFFESKLGGAKSQLGDAKQQPNPTGIMVVDVSNQQQQLQNGVKLDGDAKLKQTKT